MRPVLLPIEFDLTVLTDHLRVGLLIVVLSVVLGHYLPAGGALVVVAGAADLVHAELGHLGLSLAGATPLSRLSCFHVCIRIG